MPGSAINAARISRPSSVRMGMFCRLGFTDDSRPVADPAMLNVVCSRSVQRVQQRGQRIDVGRFQLRELPVVEHQLRDLVLARQAFEHIDRRRNGLALAVLDRLGQVQLVEQHVGQAAWAN